MSDNNFINDQLLKQYREQGYFTVEGLFTAEEVESVRDEIPEDWWRVIPMYPRSWCKSSRLSPAAKKYRNLSNSGFGNSRVWRDTMSFSETLPSIQKWWRIAKTILGPNIVMHQGQLLMKPPHFGRRKDLASRQRLFSPCAKPCVWLLGGMR